MIIPVKKVCHLFIEVHSIAISVCITELEEGEGRESNVGGGGVPQVVNGGKFSDDEDSHFFAYFLTIMVTAIIFYLVFHNKQRVRVMHMQGLQVLGLPVSPFIILISNFIAYGE